MVIVHACRMGIVRASTLAIVHVSRQSGLMFPLAVEAGGLGGEALHQMTSA